MPIPEVILNQMKCCLNADSHIVYYPVLLKCGGNACKLCVNNDHDEILNCFWCNKKHEKNELINAPYNTIVDSLIDFYIKDLLKDLNEKIESTVESLHGNFYFY
jgi:hypothetical protein